MRVLIVSDLHANPHALAALPTADAVLCAGDLVDYGPDPRSVISWCRSEAKAVAHGNHDRALAFGEDDGVGAAMREASAVTRELQRAVLDRTELEYLRSLPRVAVASIGGVRFAIAHGVAADPRRYAPLADAAASVHDVAPDASVVVLGHTHVQGVAAFDGYVAVNPGSAGMSAVGGQAHFALCIDGEIELGSVPYDVGATLADLAAIALPGNVRAVLGQAFRVGRSTSPH
jgi:predicted phosphodiesterase